MSCQPDHFDEGRSSPHVAPLADGVAQFDWEEIFARLDGKDVTADWTIATEALRRMLDWAIAPSREVSHPGGKRALRYVGLRVHAALWVIRPTLSMRAYCATHRWGTHSEFARAAREFARIFGMPLPAGGRVPCERKQSACQKESFHPGPTRAGEAS